MGSGGQQRNKPPGAVRPIGGPKGNQPTKPKTIVVPPKVGPPINKSGQPNSKVIHNNSFINFFGIFEPISSALKLSGDYNTSQVALYNTSHVAIYNTHHSLIRARL